jgi:hypothetical protein
MTYLFDACRSSHLPKHGLPGSQLASLPLHLGLFTTEHAAQFLHGKILNKPWSCRRRRPRCRKESPFHARVCLDSPQTSSRSTRLERQCVLATVTCVHNPCVLHGLNSGFVCWMCATNADMRRGCMMHLLEVPSTAVSPRSGQAQTNRLDRRLRHFRQQPRYGMKENGPFERAAKWKSNR